jgi:hypothetical protein
MHVVYRGSLSLCISNTLQLMVDPFQFDPVCVALSLPPTVPPCSLWVIPSNKCWEVSYRAGSCCNQTLSNIGLSLLPGATPSLWTPSVTLAFHACMFNFWTAPSNRGLVHFHYHIRS